MSRSTLSPMWTMVERHTNMLADCESTVSCLNMCLCYLYCFIYAAGIIYQGLLIVIESVHLVSTPTYSLIILSIKNYYVHNQHNYGSNMDEKDTVQQETFVGENFCKYGKKIFTASFHGLLTDATKKCHAPKFCGENFHKYPQNHEICESFLLRKFTTIYIYCGYPMVV